MNNTALAIIQPDELDVIQRTAKLLAASGYFGTDEGITGMAQVAAKILAGRELGFGPFASVNGIHIIQGKPTIGANLMAAAVRAHPRYDYRVKELSDTVCELEFFDGGKLAGTSRFTVQEAAIAELTTGKNAHTWRKYARNMLFARAMSNGVRWYAPDIFSGNAVYVPEELGAEVDGEGSIIEVTPRRLEAAREDVEFAMGEQPSQNAPQATTLPVAASDGNNGHDDDSTPAHNRMWGIGLRVFGPEWDNGARAWMLEKWSERHTPANVRSSASDFSDDEKTLIGDSMNSNAAALQKQWPKVKAALLQATEQLQAA